jgi:Tfp pilus assembly protein PilZ
MPTTFVEKRTFPRFPVAIPISCFIPDLNRTINTCTCDISAIGVGIVVDEELSAGTRLDLCLNMPDNGEKINRKAKVVWFNVMSTSSYRVGIRLEEPNIKPIPLVLRTINYQRKY